MNAPYEPGLAAALAVLGLAPDADARAVRRAYAQQLKQIDQATQLQAFQDLREAYELALAMLARREARAEPPSPAQTPPQEAAQPAPQARPDSAPPDGAALAQAVFNAFAERVGAVFKDEAEAMRALQVALTDDRLLNLEARTLFELKVANLIMHGWQPGHECLFSPACDVFDWERDRAHLRVFGQLGAALDAAINEKLIFFRQSSGEVELQRNVLRRLRQAEKPSVAMRRADLPLVQMLVQRYPNWLRLVASQSNINNWFNDLHRALPEPLPAVPGAAMPNPGPDFRPKPNPGWQLLKGMVGLLFAVFLLNIAFKVFVPPAPRTQSSNPDVASLHRSEAPGGQPASKRPPDTVLSPPINTDFGAGAPTFPPLYEGQPKPTYDPPPRSDTSPVQLTYLGNVTFNRQAGQVIVDEVDERSHRGASTLRPGDKLPDCANNYSREPFIFLLESQPCGLGKSVDPKTGVTTYTFRVLRNGKSLAASLALPPSPGTWQQGQAAPSMNVAALEAALQSAASITVPQTRARPPEGHDVRLGHVTFTRRDSLVVVAAVGERPGLSFGTLQAGDLLLGCAYGDYHQPLTHPSEASRCVAKYGVTPEPGTTPYMFRVLRNGRSGLASLTLRDTQPTPP